MMLGAVLGVVGGIVSGMGAQQQAQAQAQRDQQQAELQAQQAEAAAKQAEAVAESHDYNAMVATRNKAVIADQTTAAVADQTLTNDRNLNAIRGMFAANGLSFTGSSTDLVMDQAKADALGVARISYTGTLKEIQETDTYNLETMAASANRIGAKAYVDQATGDRQLGALAAAQDQQAGQISMITGILGGISSAANTMTRTA